MDKSEIERELQQLESDVLRLTHSFFGHTDAEQIALFQNEPAKTTNDKRKGYVALAFSVFQFAKEDMTLRSLCEAHYTFGIAEAISFNLGIELGNRQKGQSSSRNKPKNLKNDCLQWLSDNHSDETLKWRKAQLIRNHLKTQGIEKAENTIFRHWL
jgi:hypothetical protein